MSVGPCRSIVFSPMTNHETVRADEPRRRERQQSLVAELGRAALTGTGLAQLVADAVAAVAAGLEADRVAVFEPADDVLAANIAYRWPPDEERIPVDGDSPVSRTFREQNSQLEGAVAASPIRGEDSP